MCEKSAQPVRESASRNGNHLRITVGTEPVQVAGAQPQRRGLLIQNDGTDDLNISADRLTTGGNYTRIPPGGAFILGRATPVYAWSPSSTVAQVIDEYGDNA